MSEAIRQVVVIDMDAADPNMALENAAFFNPDGTPYAGLPSDASDVTFTPAGTIAATNVQAAIEETSGDVTAANAAIEALQDVLPAIGTVSTVIGTAAKVTTMVEPDAGSFVVLLFTNGNSANSPTVAFNGGSARAIQLGGVASTGAKCTLAAGGVAVFYFDGTILHQIGEYV